VRVRASNEYEPQGIKNPFRVLEEALAATCPGGYKWVHMYRPTRRFTEGQDFTDFVEIDYRQPALDWTAVLTTEICSPVATNLGIFRRAYPAVHFVMTYAPAEDENGGTVTGKGTMMAVSVTGASARVLGVTPRTMKVTLRSPRKLPASRTRATGRPGCPLATYATLRRRRD